MFACLAHQSSMQELDLLNPQLDPRITFSRASTKTYFGSDGLLKTAAVDEWPLEYDPITLKPIGRSVWEQRTNLLLWSNDFSNVAWTKGAVATLTPAAITAPDGTAMTLIEGSSAGPATFRQNATVTGGQPFTISARVKAGTHNTVRLRDYSVLGYMTFNLATGVIAGSDGPFSGGAITPLGGDVYRISAVATPSASGARSYGLDGVTTDAGGTFYVGTMQLEAGAFASPYIPTAGSQVTRVADEGVGNVVESVRFNHSAMTLVTGFQLNYYPPAFGYNGGLFSFGAASPRIKNQVSSGAIRPINTQLYDGVNISNARSGAYADLPVGVPIRHAVAYQVGDVIAATHQGLTPNQAICSQETDLSAIDRFIIGRLPDTASYINGFVRSCRVYPGQLTNTELQAITA